MILVKRIRFGLAPPPLALHSSLFPYPGVPGKLTGPSPSACLGLLDWPQSIKRFNGACRCWISAYLMQMKRPSLNHSVVPPTSHPPSSLFCCQANHFTVKTNMCVQSIRIRTHTKQARHSHPPSSPLIPAGSSFVLLHLHLHLHLCRPVSVSLCLSLSISISVWRNLVQSMQTST